MTKLGKHLSLHPDHEPGPDQDCLVLIGEDDTELARYLTHSSVGGASAVGESNYNALMEEAEDFTVTSESPRGSRTGVNSDGYELDWDPDIEPPDFLGIQYRYGGNEGWVRADSSIRPMLDSLSDYPCLDDVDVSRIEEDRLKEWWHDWGMLDAAIHFGRGDWAGEEEIEDLLNELDYDLFLGAMIDAGAEPYLLDHGEDESGLIFEKIPFSALCAALAPRLKDFQYDGKATLFNADDKYLWGPYAVALLKVICRVEANNA